MRIECTLKRPGGTHVKLGINGTIYHFAPEADGRHIADVTDKNDIGTFLAIKEAYQIADDEPAAPAKPARKPKPAPADDDET